ncbi:phasin family protein [Methylocapsa palsarum]|uniref:Phasin protein n=1 Tax=Methylocapsa palsarum TaxID=1612308 RepID=A0A1I3XQH7_9HYPH|nr:phasin family protein [Methylocapsa palsarum]SFK21778.1 Phasin protein [Methylocapsa palsarum]
MEQIEHHLNNTEIATDSAAKFIQNFRTIATEAIDYSRNSFADRAAFLEKLSNAKSIDTAFQIQSEYAKQFYAAFTAQAKKLNSLYSDLGKEAFKPIVELTAKVQNDRK